MSAGIYRITNQVTNEIYIGYSVNLEKRYKNYKCKDVKSQPLIYESIIKYGFDNHTFDILFTFDHNPTTYELKLIEAVFIRYYKYWKGCTMLNANEGGGGSRRWDESKRKEKSKARKGKFKASVLQYGLDGKFICKWESISKVSRDLKLDYNLLIKCLKAESSRRMVGGFQWRYDKNSYNDIPPYDDSRLSSCKPVLQYSLDGVFIKEWNYAEEIVKELGIKKSEIRSSCSRKTSRVHCKQRAEKFQWRYKESENYPMNIGKFTYPVVAQYTIGGDLVKVWESMNDAGKEHGIKRSLICSCIIGNAKTAKGFQWKRFNHNEVPDRIDSLKLPEEFKNEVDPVKLLQYNMDGTFVRTWDYPAQVGKVLGIDDNSINQNIKGHLKSAGKFRWMYGKVNEIKDLSPLRIVCQYDREGNLVKEWGSQKEIVQNTAFKQSPISNNLTGRIEHAYGFVWRYKK